ncbi:MAG TPA: tripartite tricarboxylate transporter substrate binding protein [Eoetvoesiella sp.]
MTQIRNGFFGLSRIVASCSLFVCALSVSFGANAQTWPEKPIQIVVPFAPGGIADNVARLIQPVMQDKLGQSVVVVNKPGASGSLATDYVARSKPDGYTLLLGLAAPQTLNQFIYDVGYDGLKDFAPITLINTNPMVLMVNPSLPVHTVNELIAYAKANPGKLNFAGAGGLTTYSGEIFKHMAGIDMLHVRYRGGAPAVTATVAGEVQVTFANYSDALPWIANKRLRPIALTSAHRFPQTPDVPTIAESGLPGFQVDGWSGLLAPAGTPPEIVNRIAEAVQIALKSPSVVKSMESIGAVPGGNSPEEFRKFVESETKKWGEFVETTGIKTQ